MSRHTLRLNLPEGEIEAYFDASDGPLRLMDLAAKVLELSSITARLGEQAAARNGVAVSCAAGCGACCRQLVPLSPPEAALIHQLVEGMHEPRRSAVRARFDKAVRQLAQVGLLEALRAGSDPLLYAYGESYFRLGIPCPFLEDESCSIYDVRPSRCREYLVFTPPAHCADPYHYPIGRLPVTLLLNEALTWLWAAMSQRSPRLVALPLALEFSEAEGVQRFIAADPDAMLTHLTRDLETIAANIERDTLSAQRAGAEDADGGFSRS
jgi:Fe-S-cluster containining protein